MASRSPSEDKRASLARLLAARAAAARTAGAAPAPRVQAGGSRTSGPASGLSFAQQRLWFGEQLSPGTCAYLVPIALRIKGVLDRPALEAALSELIRRHDTLRTTFPLAGDGPVAQIAAPQAARLVVEDHTGADGAEREKRVRLLCLEELRAPIDIAVGPLVRLRLAQVGTDDHVLLITAHHLVCDGVSVGVLLRELAAAYDVVSAGGRPSLPALSMQFTDFVEWERQQLDTPAVAGHLGYWTSRLAASVPLDLPADRRRPAHPSHRGAIASRTVTLPELRALRAVGQRARVSLFMVLLGAFKALLSRYADQEDVVVGAPVAGRSNPATEPLIGCFVNTLALRTDLGGDPTFLELLGRVRGTALEAFERADVPFDKLVDSMQVARDLSRAPLVQVFFNMISLAAAPHSLRGLDVEMVDAEQEGAKFDLTLYAIERPRDLLLRMVYATDLFDESTIQEMLDRFVLLLQALSADPGIRLSDLPLTGDAERLAAVSAFNAPLP